MISRWSQVIQMMRLVLENFRERCAAYSARGEMFVKVYARKLCEQMLWYMEILMNRLIYMETYIQGIDKNGLNLVLECSR